MRRITRNFDIFLLLFSQREHLPVWFTIFFTRWEQSAEGRGDEDRRWIGWEGVKTSEMMDLCMPAASLLEVIGQRAWGWLVWNPTECFIFHILLRCGFDVMCHLNVLSKCSWAHVLISFIQSFSHSGEPCSILKLGLQEHLKCFFWTKPRTLAPAVFLQPKTKTNHQPQRKRTGEPAIDSRHADSNQFSSSCVTLLSETGAV